MRTFRKISAFLLALIVTCGVAPFAIPVTAAAEPQITRNPVYYGDPMIKYSGTDPETIYDVGDILTPYQKMHSGFSFTFTGTRFEINTSLDSYPDDWGGYFDVIVNGVKFGSGTSNGPETYPAIVYDSGNMPLGTYTVELKVTAGCVAFDVSFPLLYLSEDSSVYVSSIAVTGAGGADAITTAGGTLQMSAAITPSDATYQSVTWSTNAPAIATIDQNGLLTAKGNGVVTVRATAKDGSNVFGEKSILISNNDQKPQSRVVWPNDIPDWNGWREWGPYFPADDGWWGDPPTPIRGNTPLSYTFRGTGIEVYLIDGWIRNTNIQIEGVSGTAKRVHPNGDYFGDIVTYSVKDLPLDTYTITIESEFSSDYTNLRKLIVFGEEGTAVIPVTSIAVSGAGGADTITTDGGTLQMSADVQPSSATNKTVTWSVDNTAVATVSSAGLLTAKGNGVVTVTATAKDGSGIYGEKVITVSNQAESAFVFIPLGDTILSGLGWSWGQWGKVGDIYNGRTWATFSYTFTGTGVELVYGTDNTNLGYMDVSINGGNTARIQAGAAPTPYKVTGLPLGTYTITGRVDNNNTDANFPMRGLNIYLGAVTLVTGITVTSSGSEITTAGGTMQMSADVQPSSATNKTVTWSVNNTAVATISSTGLLTAKGNGVVTVTATAKDGSGVSGSVSVTIKGQSANETKTYVPMSDPRVTGVTLGWKWGSWGGPENDVYIGQTWATFSFTFEGTGVETVWGSYGYDVKGYIDLSLDGGPSVRVYAADLTEYKITGLANGTHTLTGRVDNNGSDSGFPMKGFYVYGESTTPPTTTKTYIPMSDPRVTGVTLGWKWGSWGGPENDVYIGQTWATFSFTFEGTGVETVRGSNGFGYIDLSLDGGPSVRVYAADLTEYKVTDLADGTHTLTGRVDNNGSDSGFPMKGFYIYSTAEQPPAGPSYYVSNSGNDANDGRSESTPWRTVAKVNSMTFSPGDSILFKSGDFWFAQLEPRGSGAEGNPITFGKYGGGALPIINGSGRQQTVYLHDVEYITLQDLEIINDCTYPYGSPPNENIGNPVPNPPGPVTGADERDRRGVLVVPSSNDSSVIHGITLRNLVIHDVIGASDRNGAHSGYSQWNSGAILILSAWNWMQNRYSRSYFKDMLIENCYIYDLTTYGVYTNLYGSNRKSEGLVIRNTVVRNNGVDGLCLGGQLSPVIEYCAGYDVAVNSPWPAYIGGMWTFGCENSTIQNCEVARTAYSGDSLAYGCDLASTGTHLLQYCYSHDNQGGFFYNFWSSETDAYILRYNISQNDKMNNSDHTGTISMGHGNNYLYNNVFYSDGAGYNGIGIEHGDNCFLENNIFYTPNKVVKNGISSRCYLDNNCYFGPVGTDWSWTKDQNGIFIDPQFVAPGSAADSIQGMSISWEGFRDSLIANCAGYKLAESSPCIGMGKVIGIDDIMAKLPKTNREIAMTGIGKDFFGNALPSDTRDIGAFQSSYSKVVPRPATPQLVLSPLDGTTIMITNLSEYAADQALYGDLEYTVDVGASVSWKTYNPETGITGLTALTSYAVRVRYDGGGTYAFGPASYAASITTGRKGAESELPMTTDSLGNSGSYDFTGCGYEVWASGDGTVTTSVDGGVQVPVVIDNQSSGIACFDYDLQQGRHTLTVSVSGGASLDDVVIYNELIPATPLLNINGQYNFVIINLADYTGSALYGSIECSVNGGGWVLYDQINGVPGLTFGNNTVTVRYSGLGRYIPSRSSTGTYMYTAPGITTFGNMYPADFVKIDCTDPSITYGDGWAIANSPRWGGGSGTMEEYNGYVMATSKMGASYTVNFTGTAIDIILSKNSDHGKLTAYIDNIPVDIINLYSTTRITQQLMYRIDGLEFGPHKLTMVQTGGTYTFAEAFVIYGEEVIPAAPELSFDSGAIMIDNYADYAADIAKFGALEYSLNGGGWAAYDSGSGIAADDGLNAVAVRYAGKVTPTIPAKNSSAWTPNVRYYDHASYAASQASEAAEITTGLLVDKTDLDALIELIDKMIDESELDIYTKQSVADLLIKLGAARIVSNDGNATQDSVNDAYEALFAAYGKLQAATFTCAIKSMLAKVGKAQEVIFQWDGYGDVTITSSNEAVVRVNGNMLTPLKVGAAVITVEAANGQRVVFAVTVSM